MNMIVMLDNNNSNHKKRSKFMPDTMLNVNNIFFDGIFETDVVLMDLHITYIRMMK